MALVFDPVGRLMQLVCATPNLNFIDQWMWMLVDGAQCPHPLIYKAQIWGAHSICINLPTGSKIRAVVTPIGAMQPSDNVGMFEIDWLLYLTKPQQLLQIYTYPAAAICKFIATIIYHSGAICRTLSNNIVAFSVWRDDHEPAHCVSNCQNSSFMLAWCTCVEKFNTRVVNHTCAQVEYLEFIFYYSYITSIIDKMQALKITQPRALLHST